MNGVGPVVPNPAKPVNQTPEIVILIGAALLLVVGGTIAVPKIWLGWQNARCAGVGARGDVQMDACTTLIESERSSTKSRAFAFFERGTLYAARNDDDRAIRDYDGAIRLDPQQATYWNNRCWSRAILGRLDEARADCDQSLRLHPGEPNALDSRGLVHLKSGRPDDAIADYDAALRVDPKMPSSLYGRGIAKQRRGDAGAADDLAAATAIDADVASKFEHYGVDSRGEPAERGHRSRPSRREAPFSLDQAGVLSDPRWTRDVPAVVARTERRAGTR